MEHRRARSEEARARGVLMRRLMKQFAPGALLHTGQGKWYPGESLPRWALGCWWRRDGLPIWKNERLLADDTVDYGHGDEDARRFILTLTQVLAVDAEHVMPAYEDVWYYLWRERRLPVNVDPLDAPARRRGRARPAVESLRAGPRPGRGVRAAAAAVAASTPGQRWESGRWFLRPEHLFLIPGDSPIGYRLPLDSLPWVTRARLSVHLRAGPARRAAAASDIAQMYVRARSRGPPSPRLRRAGEPAGRSRHRRAVSRDPRRRAHGALRRAAQRPHPRLHAAGQQRRRLSRSHRGDRRGRGAVAACRSSSRARRRRTTRA